MQEFQRPAGAYPAACVQQQGRLPSFLLYFSDLLQAFQVIVHLMGTLPALEIRNIFFFIHW
jgi:hypothetical protein